jgi:hypothetical protein
MQIKWKNNNVIKTVFKDFFLLGIFIINFKSNLGNNLT